MFRLKFRLILVAFFILSITACMEKYKHVPTIHMPEPHPEIVKEYKSFKLRSPMKNTKILLNEGDAYSIFASGSINIWPRGPKKYHNLTPSDGWPFMARIGKKHKYFHPLRDRFGRLDTATRSGNLYIGIQGCPVDTYGNPITPEDFRDDIGHFNVDVIVWASDDFEQIASFLEKMEQLYPYNLHISDALRDARWSSSILSAHHKASKDIEATKKELQDLKKQQKEKVEESVEINEEKKSKPDTEQINEPIDKDVRIANLEAKLSQLQETLKDLEEMKIKFEEEKEKATNLSKELAEKELKEKDLLAQLEESEKNPPVIVCAYPRDGLKVQLGIIRLSGVIEDDQGIANYEIFLNDVPTENKEKRGLKLVKEENPKRIEFYDSIKLQKGKNLLKIIAVDSEGISTEKEVTVFYIDNKRKIWVVVIGIDNYQGVKKLKYATKDAQAIYNHFVNVNKIPKENIALLLNQDANLVNIRSFLGTHLKRKAGVEDMVIIYFAGHGAVEKDTGSQDGDGLEKYLLPYDANSENLYASALPMSEISRIFNRIRSKRLIFFADACYSGASGGRTISISGMRSNISEAFLDRITEGKGRIIITASGPNEISTESDALEHGVFTYYLLEALQGKADFDQNRAITVNEVYKYLSDNVPKATEQAQHPIKKGTMEGHLVLSIVD